MKLILTLFILLFTLNLYALEELVIQSESSYIPTHENRFSFLAGLNPNIIKASEVKNFTFSFAKKATDYWIDSNLLFTQGKFYKLTTNNPAATEQSTGALADSDLTTITIGLGLGRETRYFQNFLPFENIYEYMAADITYNTMKEDVSGYSFTGPGILAKFQLYKKFSEFMSIGGQFIYQLAPLKRKQNTDTEYSSGRTLTMSTLTMGIDFSFYL